MQNKQNKGIDLPKQLIDKIKLSAFLGIMLIGTVALYIKYKNRTPYSSQISQLKKLIANSFPNAEQSLCPLVQTKTQKITDQNIQILIHYAPKLQKKQSTTVNTHPFSPPFQQGLMITQLTPGHRLFFNKFYHFKYHLIVATQSFISQSTRLTIDDFKQVLLVMKSLNGLFFFNSGPLSGFSQQHKHIQILPNEALKLPIMAKILSQIKKQKLKLISSQQKQQIPIYCFKGFQFIHTIMLLPQQIHKNTLQQISIYYKKIQNIMYNYLSHTIGQKDMSYNIIGCNKFMLIIPRKQQKIIGLISVNAICFMGSILIKNLQAFNQVKDKYIPTELLSNVTFPVWPKL